MAFTFEQIFAADPANPSNIAQNAAVTIFAPGDVTMTPLTITDPDGQPLANPITVNANGFGSAFAHATLDRVAWAGGGFTGYFTSYEGIKQVAVDAQAAAEAAAATAGADAAAVATAAIGDATDDAAAAASSAATAASNAASSATAAANSAALVGAPADTAVETLINSASATKAALNATYGRSVNVAAYGATGNGTTDDTAAIHAARAATTPGQSLYFPPGTYLHSGLMSGRADETWQLETGAILKLKASAANHNLVVTHNGFTITGGVIDGNRANQAAGSYFGVFISAANDVTVSGVTIKAVLQRGVYSRNSDRTTVERCKISDTGENAVLVEPTDTATAPVLDPVIRNNFVDRSAEPVGTIVEGGLKVHGNLTSNQKVLRAKIHGNTVLLPDNMANTGGAQICIELHTNAERGSIIGNTTRGGTMGISVDKSAYSVVTSNICTRFSYYGIEWAASPDGTCANNNIDGDGYGVVGIVQTTVGSHRTSLSGNTIRGITQDGISLNGGNDSTISANIIVLPTGARYAINVSGGPAGVTITGNSINTSAANYGINVAPSNNLVISNNTLNGNSVALKAIAVDRSTQVIINGNSMRNFTQHGVLLFAQSTFTLDNITVFGNEFSSVGTTIGTQLSGGGALGNAVLLGQTRYGITLPSFTTGTRPSAVTAGVGSKVYDKTLFKTITSDGTNWRDETGTVV